MKLLLQNQNIFQKLKNALNNCIKKFYDTYETVERVQMLDMIVDNKLIFIYSSGPSEMFSAQIQAHQVEKNEIELTDGNVKFIVKYRDNRVLDRANFFDSPNNSLVIIKQWSYEIYYFKNTFQINLVIDEMRCIDIITTIFYCKLELDFTQGIQGISKSSSLSNQIYEYSAQYYKAIQLLKKLLINDSYISELYNSTKSKQQPKLIIFQTFKPKNNLIGQSQIKFIQQNYQDDFGEGCLLENINFSNQNTKQKEIQKNLNKIYNCDNEISNKKRIMKNNQEICQISLQKQIKICQEEDEDSDSKTTIKNSGKKQYVISEQSNNNQNRKKIQNQSYNHNNQSLRDEDYHVLEEEQQQNLRQKINNQNQQTKVITLKKNQDILFYKPQKEGNKYF